MDISIIREKKESENEMKTDKETKEKLKEVWIDVMGGLHPESVNRTFDYLIESDIAAGIEYDAEETERNIKHTVASLVKSFIEFHKAEIKKARSVVFEFAANVKQNIRDCQKKGHVQQVAYSTYHDTLTQVCFICQKVRTGMKEASLNRSK